LYALERVLPWHSGSSAAAAAVHNHLHIAAGAAVHIHLQRLELEMSSCRLKAVVLAIVSVYGQLCRLEMVLKSYNIMLMYQMVWCFNCFETPNETQT